MSISNIMQPICSANIYGKPFVFLFSISRYQELLPDIRNSNSRYLEINFRYREIIIFPISGNDFQISGIDFRILGYLFDFPISGNQFPISENRHQGSKSLWPPAIEYRLTTPAPINNGPPGHTNPSSACSVHVGTVITTSVIHSAHDTHAMEN